MVSLQVLDVSPAANPDKIRFFATLSGNAGVQGVGDPLNLQPFASGANPGGFTNPQGIPLPELPVVLSSAPSIAAENLAGYYTQETPLVPAVAVTEGVAGGIAMIGGVGLRVFAPGGGELASNAGYTATSASLTSAGAGLILELYLPHNQ